MRSVTVIAASLFIGLLGTTGAGRQSKRRASCVGCHSRKTPHHVRVWRRSEHGKRGVGCAACHGKDHGQIKAGKRFVGAKICGRCHPDAYRNHKKSRHGMGLHSGWGCTRALSGRDKKECRFCHRASDTKPFSTVQCARFLKQSSAMGQAGCNRCHLVERSCAACHSNHDTSLKIVESPTVCAKCHMGPDHPQWEMYQTSKHGTLYAAKGGKNAPTCQRCHLAKNSHDVSRGLTMSPTGKVFPAAKFNKQRARMLKVCAQCHARTFAKRDLERADRIRQQSVALVKEAEAIIRDLADRRLLDPMPQSRPPHPQRGRALVLDGQILYEDTSRIEALFFQMKKFYLAQTIKGAYHQNPAYTHWYGNARLKLALVKIKAEASRLRARRYRGGKRRWSLSQAIEAELSRLKRRFERKAIDRTAYDKARKRLLLRYLGAKKRR